MCNDRNGLAKQRKLNFDSDCAQSVTGNFIRPDEVSCRKVSTLFDEYSCNRMNFLEDTDCTLNRWSHQTYRRSWKTEISAASPKKGQDMNGSIICTDVDDVQGLRAAGNINPAYFSGGNSSYALIVCACTEESNSTSQLEGRAIIKVEAVRGFQFIFARWKLSLSKQKRPLEHWEYTCICASLRGHDDGDVTSAHVNMSILDADTSRYFKELDPATHPILSLIYKMTTGMHKYAHSPTRSAREAHIWCQAVVERENTSTDALGDCDVVVQIA